MSVDEAPLWGGAGADEAEGAHGASRGLVRPEGSPGAVVVGVDASGDAVRSATGVGSPGPEGASDSGPLDSAGCGSGSKFEQEEPPPNVLRAAAMKCALSCALESET